MAERAIGDNSRHFGEELREDVETILSDDHEKLFHFAKWHIDDYIAGTVGMKLETEGAYIRFLMRLYQRGKPLPDDDRFMSIVMNMSIRVWKRIKDSLISIGKIVRRSGCLTNPRFERERRARAEQLRKQADAARKRHQRERNEKAQKAETSQKFGESFPEVSPKHSQNISKKTNEINGSNGNQLDITRVLKSLETKKEEPPVGPPEGDKPKRARQMPEGWEPSDGCLEWAAGEKIGASARQIAEQLDHFRDHHLARGSRFQDWDRAFQTWMRNAKRYGHFLPPKTQGDRQKTADDAWLEREFAAAQKEGLF